MLFYNSELERKYHRLGFIPEDYGVKLKIGNIELDATEHPLDGVTIFLTHIGPRTMAQYKISMPTMCTTEQIAAMIYLNIAQTFPDQASLWKQHFQKVSIPLFQ